MRYSYLLCFILIFSHNSFAQNNTFHPVEVRFNSNYADLSDSPTLDEIITLFSQVQVGNCDFYLAMEKVSGKGDNSLQGLAEYLFSNNQNAEKKDYALHALERIGSPRAYDLLIQYADNTTNPEYKAIALIMLTNDYYAKASNEELVPTERILPLYEESLQNTLQSELYVRSIQEIAKEGIQKWTGVEASTSSKTPQELSSVKSASTINTLSEKKAVWNKEKKIFTFENGEGK